MPAGHNYRVLYAAELSYAAQLEGALPNTGPVVLG